MQSEYVFFIMNLSDNSIFLLSSSTKACYTLLYLLPEESVGAVVYTFDDAF